MSKEIGFFLMGFAIGLFLGGFWVYAQYIGW